MTRRRRRRAAHRATSATIAPSTCSPPGPRDDGLADALGARRPGDGDGRAAGHRRRRPVPAARRPRRRRRAGRAELAAALDAADLPGSVRRVAVVASHPDDGHRRAHVPASRRRGRPAVLDGRRRRRRSDPATFEEDVKFRGLHPMIARRLQMWRLANFEIRPPAGGRRGPPLRLRRPGEPEPTSASSPSPRCAT